MTALAATATSDLWSAWSLDPLALIGAAIAVGFFLSGWRRLHRRRPEAAPWTRIPLFLAGVAIVLVALLSPLDAIVWLLVRLFREEAEAEERLAAEQRAAGLREH